MKKLVFLILVFGTCVRLRADLFSGMYHSRFVFQDLKKYAERHPELGAMQPRDYLLSLHWERQRGKQLALFKRMPVPDRIATNAFTELVIDILKNQYQNDTGVEYAYKVTLPPGAQCAIFGDLQGAYHSLIRSLSSLVDNDLKVRADYQYIVFNGNVVSGAPFALETLVVVLLLMQRNPGKVIFLKGPHEQLKMHAQSAANCPAYNGRSGLEQAEHRLFAAIDLLFDRLPLALYIVGSDPNKGIIRISHAGRESSAIDERVCAEKLRSLRFGVIECCFFNQLQPRTLPTDPPPIIAIIKSEDRLKSYEQFTGLYRLEPDLDAVAWRVFSGPSAKYRRYFHFNYDSYVTLSMADTIYDSELRHRYSLIDRQQTVAPSFPEQLHAFQVGYNIFSGEVTQKPFVYQATSDFSREREPSSVIPSPNEYVQRMQKIQKKVEALSRRCISLSQQLVAQLASKGCNDKEPV